MNVDKTFGELGLVENEIPQLSLNAENDACIATNPKIITHREIEHLYEEAI